MHSLLRRKFAWLGFILPMAACAQPLASELQNGYIPPDTTTPKDAGEGDAASDGPAFSDAGQQTQPDAAQERDANPGQEGEEADPGAEPDAGSDENDEPDPAEEPVCQAPELLCGTSCVNPNTSVAHCGGCGQACPGNLTCNQGTCRAPQNCSFDRFNGRGYVFCSNSVSWTPARSRCRNMGLGLALIEDEAENAFVTRGERLWIGVSDRDNEGRFRLVNPSANTTRGAEATYLPWGDGEPNNSEKCSVLGVLNCTDEDCVEVREDGLWNDEQCGDKTEHGYVCESY